jgi:hypothetical protein
MKLVRLFSHFFELLQFSGSAARIFAKFQAQSTTHAVDDDFVCDVAMGVGLHSRANASPRQGNEHLLLRSIRAINTDDVLYTKHPRFLPHHPLRRTLGRNAMVHTALQKHGLTTGF